MTVDMLAERLHPGWRGLLSALLDRVRDHWQLDLNDHSIDNVVRIAMFLSSAVSAADVLAAAHIVADSDEHLASDAVEHSMVVQAQSSSKTREKKRDLLVVALAAVALELVYAVVIVDTHQQPGDLAAVDSLLLQHCIVDLHLDSRVVKVGADRVVELERQSELLAAVLQPLAVLARLMALPSCQLLAARQKSVRLVATVLRDWLLKLRHLA